VLLLSHIKDENNLIDVLKKYDTNFYIETNPEVLKNGCYEFIKPRKQEAIPVTCGGFYVKNLILNFGQEITIQQFLKLYELSFNFLSVIYPEGSRGKQEFNRIMGILSGKVRKMLDIIIHNSNKYIRRLRKKSNFGVVLHHSSLRRKATTHYSSEFARLEFFTLSSHFDFLGKDHY